MLLLSDRIIFILVQGAFHVFLFFAIAKHLLWKPAGVITRGKESRSTFLLFHGLSVLLLFQIISTTDLGVAWNWKPWLSLLNFVAVGYLAFFNGWFRNKWIGLIIKIERRPDS